MLVEYSKKLCGVCVAYVGFVSSVGCGLLRVSRGVLSVVGCLWAVNSVAPNLVKS